MTAGAEPGEWPVLVTGAGGFIGGHVARGLAAAGHRVVGLARRPPRVEPADPAIDWRIGDLREPDVRRGALRGVRGVVHAAGWVSLGADPTGESRVVNVEATRGLLADAAAAGVERFVYTSTLHTLAAGTAEEPADEATPWNLRTVDAPYSRTKREAERLTLDGFKGTAGVVVCPGMAIGPRDLKPTSTRVLLMMAAARCVFLPGGGIPVVDAEVVARAHRMALTEGEAGSRYAVVGPYLSYREMARLVARLAGRPRLVGPVPDAFERPLVALARALGRGKAGDGFSAAAVAGGFLRLHVSGARADRTFGLTHPPPIRSIYGALEDARRSGRAPWLHLRDPEAPPPD
ncbi:NAD-dependent epimerase/dehydratase family protein [Planctomyces sp. SH-PL62]|uniref:NAD-dependent epimerase/dehydratase family protein n=1 Tax=Planctomyces sp. SH-PL62 TaxID=1636152 RepID=UPI00078C86AC|nr:NAD-dependent epimerase/dehydratase family protein [Planctomyces sp. SH-PL62]AMV38768.1 3 beta-hydroxysteroid dehydrogenase/Delta 5-->4-isomerase [Planctomyces sp. SH-PL62]